MSKELLRTRIGNTVTVVLPVLTRGDAVSLVGRDITIMLVDPNDVKTPVSFTVGGVDNNIATFVVEGTSQTATGTYRAEVYENYRGTAMAVYDCDIFVLVARTEYENDGNEGVSSETTTLDPINIAWVGRDGYTPYIQDGYWYINGTSTNVKAAGENGDTPYIENGYWYIGGVSTGIKVDYTNEEAQRAASEQVRVVAEAARVQAEAARTLAENSRLTEESGRSAAEGVRILAERDRQAEEATRQTQEEIRHDNEEARVEAELGRAASEASRAQVEATRVANETARTTAEATRAANEQTRVSDETDRATAETARIAAETARETAEDGRTSAEATRVSNEQTRVSNESTRQSNESARQAAEAARQSAYTAAENARDAAFAAKEATRDAANEAALNCAETLAALGPKCDQNTTNIANLQQAIDEIEPIVINGDVTNAPDEEDVTTDSNNLLKLKDRPTAVNQKGYKILRKGVALATQMADANTIYEVRYAFDLDGGTLTIPSGCELEFNGGKLSNGTLSVNDCLIKNGCFNGLKLSGSITNEKIDSSWFGSFDDFIDSVNGLTGYTTIYIKQGVYQTSKKIELYENENIIINGNKSVINVENCGVFITFNSSLVQGNFTELTLVALPIRGERYIYVSDASNVNVGDTILLRNMAENSFTPHRDYRDGEFCVVTEVDDSTNTLKVLLPINGVYSDLSECRLFVAKLKNIQISDLNIECKSRLSAESESVFIRATYSRMSVTNMNITNFDIGISTLGCLDVFVDNCRIVAANDTADFLNGYGVMLGNTQNAVISNCYLFAANHGISTGGQYAPIFAIPCRFIKVINCECYGYRETFGGGIQSHGNIEYFNVSHCITNGIEIGGDYTTIEDCDVICDGEFKGIYFNEVSGYSAVFRNNRFVDANIRMRRGQYVLNPSYPKGVEEIRFDGNNFKYQSSFTVPQGNVGYFYFNILVVPNYSGDVRMTFMNNVIENLSSAIVPMYFKVNNFKFTNNNVRNMELSVQMPKSSIKENTFNDCTMKVSGSYYPFEMLEILDNNINISEGGFTQIAGYFLYVANSGNNNVASFMRNTISYSGTISAAVWPVRCYAKNTFIFVYKDNTINYQSYNTKSGWIECNNLILGTTNVISQDTTYDYANQPPLYYKADAVFGDIMRREVEQAGQPFTKETIARLIGTTSERPNAASVGAGYEYYDSTLKAKIMSNGTDWVNMDGTPLLATSGTFANKPTPSSAGFQYFCTSGASIDGGTTEKTNIVIYYTGSGWVDANGNAVTATT